MKNTQFIDTNIFIRYLTKDDQRKHRACLALFQQAERSEVSLTTSESVVAEVVYVLSSAKHYGLSRRQIQVALSRLLILPGIRLEHHSTFITALGLYAENSIDFEDCLTVAHMKRERLTEIYSYDKDFEPVQAIHRVEP